MAGPRLLDLATDGTREVLREGEADTFAIQTIADVEAVVEANKRARMAGGGGYTPSRDLRRVASIPPSVQLLWIARYGADPLAKGNESLLRRILNDPEWAYLRTAPGRL